MGWISPWEDTANMANQLEKLGDSIVVEKSMIESSKMVEKTILSQFFQGPWEVTQSGRGDERSMERYGKAAWNDTAGIPWFFLCPCQHASTSHHSAGSQHLEPPNRSDGAGRAETTASHFLDTTSGAARWVVVCQSAGEMQGAGGLVLVCREKTWNTAWGLCGTDQRCLKLGAVKHVKHVHSNSESDHEWECTRMNQMTWQFLSGNLR